MATAGEVHAGTEAELQELDAVKINKIRDAIMPVFWVVKG